MASPAVRAIRTLKSPTGQAHRRALPLLDLGVLIQPAVLMI
jgi:hypothetical protein